LAVIGKGGARTGGLFKVLAQGLRLLSLFAYLACFIRVGGEIQTEHLAGYGRHID
jgi:hypothetical protein